MAAARSEREQRPGRRSGHRHQVPHLLRPPPEQGGLARASASGRLRAVRHRVQRLRAYGAGRGAARQAPCARPRDARRVPPALYHLAERRRPPPTVQRTRRRAAPPPAGTGRPAASRNVRLLRIVGGASGDRQAGGSRHRSDALRGRAVTARRRRRGHAVRESAPEDHRGGTRAARRVRRAGERRRARRALRQRPGGGLPTLRRGLRLRDARGVSGPQAGRHRDRFGRHAGVRRGRRIGPGMRAARGSRRRGVQRARRPQAGRCTRRAAALGDAANPITTPAPRPSRGTA